jgi:hypothetical protein
MGKLGLLKNIMERKLREFKSKVFIIMKMFGRK